MSNLAEQLIEPAINSNAMFESIIKSLRHRMLDFIKEQLNAAS